MDDGLQVRFWGTRGSCPAPFPDRMEYGGNTSCVSVRFAGGIVIFDGGTGIAALGRWLEEERRQERWDEGLPIYIFVSHLHLDHIVGIPVFSCLFWKNARIFLYGYSSGDGAFRRQLGGIMGPPYWPVSIEQVPAAISWHEIKAGETCELPEGIRVRTLRSAHPNGGVLFRLEKDGQSVVYGLDCELSLYDGRKGNLHDAGKEDGNHKAACAGAAGREHAGAAGAEHAGAAGAEHARAAGAGRDGRMWSAYREFAGDCGLLIFDAPYTEAEYPAYRGYGHSFWQQGIRMAKECRAARLCICHHDWGRTDGSLEEAEKELHELAAGSGVKAAFAKEGMCVRLEAGTELKSEAEQQCGPDGTGGGAEKHD